MLNITITGAFGFLGTLTARAFEKKLSCRVFRIGRQSTDDEIFEALSNSDLLIHLAGTNRSQMDSEFIEGNVNYTKKILKLCLEAKPKIPVFYSSSTHATQESPYRTSKRDAEEVLREHAQNHGVFVRNFRITNIFGAGGKPNYNSVIATYCHNISRDLNIQISNPDHRLRLIWVGDVIESFIAQAKTLSENTECFVDVEMGRSEKSLGEIASTLQTFKNSRRDGILPNLLDRFEFLLHSVFTSYLPADRLAVEPKIYQDNRGKLFELVKSNGGGQIFVSTTKPGITRGQHFHFRKIEKYCVISGNGLVRLRNLNNQEITEYSVSGEKIEILDIPTGFTHSLTNVGTTDMVTLFWANEIFDPNDADTFAENV